MRKAPFQGHGGCGIMDPSKKLEWLSTPADIHIAPIQLLHTRFPSYSIFPSVLPQNTQAGEYFRRIIVSFSVNISSGSFSPIPSVRLISMGSTIRPSSSTFLTIPVDFIYISPPIKQFHPFFYNYNIPRESKQPSKIGSDRKRHIIWAFK